MKKENPVRSPGLKKPKKIDPLKPNLDPSEKKRNQKTMTGSKAETIEVHSKTYKNLTSNHIKDML